MAELHQYVKKPRVHIYFLSGMKSSNIIFSESPNPSDSNYIYDLRLTDEHWAFRNFDTGKYYDSRSIPNSESFERILRFNASMAKDHPRICALMKTDSHEYMIYSKDVQHLGQAKHAMANLESEFNYSLPHYLQSEFKETEPLPRMFPELDD